MTGPSRRLALTATVVAVAASIVFLVAVWIAMPWVMGDTPFVLDGSNAFLKCLSAHDYSGCGFTGTLNYWGLMSPIGDWPLLQHVPDLISIGLGADGHAARTRILELLSVAGVVGAVVSARFAFVRAGHAPWFWAFLIAVLSSPLIWYARTTAGEALATGLLVAFVAATVVPAPPIAVGLAAVGACWTKETSYPFVAALGLLGLVLARRRTGLPIRRHLAWGAAGMGVAIVAASWFNVVRFGSVFNPNVSESQLHTPGLARKLEYALAVVAAPNGGVVVFLPVASLLVLAACVLALRGRRTLDVRPAVVLVAVIVVLSVGLGSWWTPFGWFGYGPRLALPWVLPILLLALIAYGDALRQPARRALTPAWRAVAIFAVVLAATLPHIGQLWRPNAIGRFFLLPGKACEAPWRGGTEGWYDCQDEQMWLDRPMSLYALRGVATPGGIATTVVVALGLAGCFVLLRRELRPTC